LTIKFKGIRKLHNRMFIIIMEKLAQAIMEEATGEVIKIIITM
jgi:hypothetical protein